MTTNDKTSRTKQDALIHILRVVSSRSAKTLTYTTAILGMAALIPGLQLPPELTVLAMGIGVEAMGNLLERVANQ